MYMLLLQRVWSGMTILDTGCGYHTNVVAKIWTNCIENMFIVRPWADEELTKLLIGNVKSGELWCKPIWVR